MRLKNIKIENFRNIEKETLVFSPETNLIYGDNAQGKTNVIEAIYAFSHARSFRRAKEKELIKFDANSAKISAVFEEKNREANFEIIFSKKGSREFYYNGMKLEKMKDFFGHFLSVLFVPEYLKIIKNGPSERRSFIDSALCQIKPLYVSSLFSYHRLCEEKNALIKNYRGSEEEKLLLEVYNEKLIKSASKISRERFSYLSLLEESVKKHFEEMSGGDKISFKFLLSGEIAIDKDADFEEIYKNLFEKSLENDIRLSRMSCGAQLDDVEILINSKSARSFASQGQMRSAVVSLKLGEGEVIEKIMKTSPVYLFDDILSELDEKRREYILNRLDKKQVIITSCMREDNFSKTAFYAEKGTYKQV